MSQVRRLSFILGTAVFLAATVLAQPAAAKDDVGMQPKLENRTFQLVPEAKRLIAARQITVGQVAHADGVGILAVPPMGGCDFTNIHGQVSATYINGALTDTETTYFSSVLCTTTAPGQTMRFISDLAHLYINFQHVNTGSVGSCSYPTNNPCNLTSSSGFYACGGGAANCAGTYHAQHFAEMTLPDGWQFTSWPAEFCVDLDNRQTLICTYSTEGTPVPPNA